MVDLKELEIWFITGSQHLYGEETLIQVTEHSKTIVNSLSKSAQMPVQVMFKPTVKTAEEIYTVCQEANVKKKLYRNYCLDAYFFSCQDVDRRIKDFI